MEGRGEQLKIIEHGIKIEKKQIKKHVYDIISNV